MIYLDNAATTKVMAEAAQGAYFAMTEAYGNPSSLHKMGIEAERLIAFAKKQILNALGDQNGGIIFTSGATEANNTAIWGLAKEYGRRKKRIVTTAIEHPSVLAAVNRLRENGFEVVETVPDENGEISAQALIDAVDENTCLISAMLVNNETGYILPIAEAFSRIKKMYPECRTHCDCVQGFEKLVLSAKKLCADVITLSGHKIYAPKGTGAMYIKKGVRMPALMAGGGQQGGIRSGTEAVPLIYAFGKAVEALTPTVSQRYDHVQRLNKYAKDALSRAGAVILSRGQASPYILSAAVPEFKSETMLHFLESRQIYVSSGSACSKGKKSSVLKAFNLPGKYIDSVLRISFSYENSAEDIDALASAVGEGMKTLARIK